MSADEFIDVRLRLGWTQLQLAIWGGVSVGTIRRFEGGKQRIPEIWRRALEGLDGAAA